MIIEVNRVFKGDTYTIGKLSVDGRYECDTLEDKVRNLPTEEKIHGQTAIPAGTYKVTITFSNHFKRELPLLMNVPYFEGIRIHPGNDAADTEGCLLVGQNTVKGKVTNSRVCFDKLFEKIKVAFDKKEPISIVIK